MSWWQDFHFLRPWWLLGLIIPCLVYVFSYRQAAARSAWYKVCDKNLLDFLLVKSGDAKSGASSAAAAAAALFLVLALAGPSWIKKENPALSVENPVMILLNMSGEMWNKDVSPSRIERAKYVIKDLTKELKNTESGLIVYSKEPFMITPLSEDASIIDNMLAALQLNVMPQDGDRLDRAIDLAVSRMTGAGLQSGSLIVISSDVGERFDAALASAAAAADKGFSVNVINVSPKTGDKLKMAAEKGGGVYLNYNQNLAGLVKKINDVTDKEIKQSQNMQTVWEDGGWYLLWLPALLILLYFRRGALLALLFCLFSMGTAQANWFLNDNQNALRNFKQQNYAEAAEQFKDVQWKASAAYKNGDYAAAYENFSKGNDATALYNQGNALAKSGKIAEAIKKYEEVLQKQPDFEDAEFNLEYLKKQQQQQNQQQQSQNNKKQNEQQKQQQSQGSNKQQEQNKQSEQNERQSPQEQQYKKQDSASSQQQNNSEQQQNTQQQEMQQNSQSGGSGDKEHQQGKPAQDEAQKQAAENQQNRAERQNSAKPSQNQSGEADEPANEQNEAEAQLKPAEQQGDEEQQGMSVGTNDEKSAEEQEKIRARMQKFRRIPEDKGGLLRAMIYKEYAKRRYND